MFIILLLLFSVRAFYNAEQRSKRSGEGGMVDGGRAQEGEVGTRGVKSGFDAGGHSVCVCVLAPFRPASPYVEGS